MEPGGRTGEANRSIQIAHTCAGLVLTHLVRLTQGLDAAGREALLSASHVLTTVPPVGDFRRDPVLLSQRDELQVCGLASLLHSVREDRGNQRIRSLRTAVEVPGLVRRERWTASSRASPLHRSRAERLAPLWRHFNIHPCSVLLVSAQSYCSSSQAAAEAMRSGGPLRWVGYLSSTGVYGDHGGEWVDETAALLSRVRASTH